MRVRGGRLVSTDRRRSFLGGVRVGGREGDVIEAVVVDDRVRGETGGLWDKGKGMIG